MIVPPRHGQTSRDYKRPGSQLGVVARTTQREMLNSTIYRYRRILQTSFCKMVLDQYNCFDEVRLASFRAGLEMANISYSQLRKLVRPLPLVVGKRWFWLTPSKPP